MKRKTTNRRRALAKLENQLGRQNTNNILHLILTLITAGIWSIVWVIIAINNYFERVRIISKIVKIEDELEATA